MRILCRCIRLDTISATISEDGGTGIWDIINPKQSQFIAQVGPGASCGGSDRLAKVECVLVMNSCGTIRVSIAGVSSKLATDTTAATAVGAIDRADSQQIMEGDDTGAGHCESNGLSAIIGAASMTVAVRCGQQVTLSLWSRNDNSPQIEVSWLVVVVG